MSQGKELQFKEADHCEEEMRLLLLLKKVQPMLAEALNSLGGTTPESLEAKYIVECSRAVNQAADGYLVLRRIGAIAASKILVRTMIEAMFVAGAAAADKSFIFRKAYSEWNDDNKLFVRDDASRAESESQWAEFKAEFLKLYPGYPADEKAVSTRDSARLAGLDRMYDMQYRLYCKFTHAALAAVDGHWKDLSDPYDTRTVIGCVLKMMELLRALTGVNIPDLKPCLTELSKPD